MDKKIVKILPIILIIIAIASTICSSIKGSSSISTHIIIAETILMTYVASFLVFYVDFRKNKSILSIIGLIGIGICFILAILYYIKSNNMSKMDYDSIMNAHKNINTIRKLYTTMDQIVNSLRLVVIIGLISIKVEDSITKLSKKSSFVAIIISLIINIYMVWKSVETTSFVYRLGGLFSNLTTILVFAFIIFQLFAEEEKEVPSNTNTEVSVSTPPQPSSYAFSMNGPKFRNPALEEQEARIAAEKAQREALQQMTNNIPQQSSIPVPYQATTTMIPTGQIQQNQNIASQNTETQNQNGQIFR